ncbi:peroxidase-like [Chelonus insularis]|uniref:peroxidase-like n=1 Tax=Chelonus insularis TaxID=460826 RepID=UPI00158C67D0|nr:peroxidase-like [Chelonus insularis]
MINGLAIDLLLFLVISQGHAVPQTHIEYNHLFAKPIWSNANFITTIKNYFSPRPIINNNVQFIHQPPVQLTPLNINVFSGQPEIWNSFSRNGNKNSYPLFNECDINFTLTCSRDLSYRTYDGSCNNLLNPTWGMAQTRYARLLPPIYSDSIWEPAISTTGKTLPRSRVLSYTLFPQLTVSDPQWSLATMQWGQIITHDMAQLATAQMLDLPSPPCCDNNDQVHLENINNPDCFPMLIGPDDPVFNYRKTQCFGIFSRTATDLQSMKNCSFFQPQKPADQITMVTHYMDLSIVYGSSEKTANNLRRFKKGLMKTIIRNQREWLPSVPYANVSADCNADSFNNICYTAGDTRVNQNPQLTVLQILLIREHNRIARILKKINSHWNDETIFQESRRIVIAEYQQISYYEWMPIIVGPENAYNHKLIYEIGENEYIDDYDVNVNPSVLNEHSNGAFRVFHSLIAGYLKLIAEDRSSQKSLRLSDWFQKPGIIEQANNMDDLTRGLADQPEQARNEYYDHEITLYLFRGLSKLGSDLKALDIHRGRDHGLPTYNDYRSFCGLKRAQTWSDFADWISPKNIQKLIQLYESPDDVDFVVGGSLEENSEDALTGPTFLCVIIEQFYRTRVGDRYWFESSDPVIAFTKEQLSEIRKTTLARFMCDNSDGIISIQRRAFERLSDKNPLVSCDELPSIDFSYWKDYAPELLNTKHARVLYKK